MLFRSIWSSQRLGHAGARALVCGAVMSLLAAGAPRAYAHGPAPSALSVVDDDATGPKVIRLTGGYARRVDGGRYEFLCPAAWGDDVVLPAGTIPNGPVVIAGGTGLYLVDATGAVTPHPDPAAKMPATDFAQLGGKLYVLRTNGANSEVLEVTPTSVRMVFSDPGSWSAIAATSSAIGLMRLTDTKIEQLRISADGMVIDRGSAPAPMEPILVTARATSQELFAVVVTANGRELGQIMGDQWKRIALASSAIAGPAEVPNGDVYIAIDSVISKLSDTQSTLMSVPVSCLGRLGDIAYACTRDGLSSMAPAGVAEPIFALSSMLAPNMAKVAPDQQSLCEAQWEHFRFDLLALGVTLMDPPATVDDGQAGAAGVAMGAAGMAGTGVAGMGVAGAAGADVLGAAGGSVVAMPPTAASDAGGCAVASVRGEAASVVTWALGAALLLIRRRRRR